MTLTPKMNLEFKKAQDALVRSGWHPQTKRYQIETRLGSVHIIEIAEGIDNPRMVEERTYSIVACGEILSRDKAVEVLMALSELGFMPFICIIQLQDGLRLTRSIDVPDYIYDSISCDTRIDQGVDEARRPPYATTIPLLPFSETIIS